MPVPPELDGLALACLEKDRRHRPHDASAVLDRLLRYRSGEAWANESARTWWEQHLPQLTGPLTIKALPSDVAAQAVVN